MSLQSETELKYTRKKLRRLEEHDARREHEPAENPHVRELSLRSLKRIMNQLKEEIARYESRAGAAGKRS